MAAAGVGTKLELTLGLDRLSEIGFVSGVRMSLSKTHLSLLLLLLVGLSVAASQKESEDMKEICSNLTECRQGMKKWKTTAEALEVKAQKDEKIVEEQKSQLLDALLVMKEQVSFLEKQLQELRNEMKEDTKEIGRQKRQAEECLTDQYWDGRKCEWCTCPTGQQLRAVFCGHGVLVGNPGCQDCPPLTYRNGTDNNQTCHRCSSCSDPDAFVETPCSFDTDTVCRCRNGTVMVRGYCISCRDYPDEEGCPPVTTQNPETLNPEPCHELLENVTRCLDETPGCSCTLWKVGVGFACFLLSFNGIVEGIRFYRKRARQQRQKRQRAQSENIGGRIEMKEQSNGTSHAVDAHAGAGDDHDAEHPPTENRVSAANGEANGLLEANGGGVNELNAE